MVVNMIDYEHFILVQLVYWLGLFPLYYQLFFWRLKIFKMHSELLQYVINIIILLLSSLLLFKYYCKGSGWTCLWQNVVRMSFNR